MIRILAVDDHQRIRAGIVIMRFALGAVGMLSLCSRGSALDPSLDISQYAHTAWKIRDGFTRGAIFSMAQTPDGYLWLGTTFGLVRFDGVQAVPWQPPEGEQLPDNFIHDLLVARNGALWIGTRKGLASWKDGKLTKYPEGAGQRVSALLEDAEGTIWFGLEEPGRLCAVRAARTQCYGDGRFGWSVASLYKDHKGNLWASAETGLWRWAPGPPEKYPLSGPVEATSLAEGDSGALLMTTGVSSPLATPSAGSLEGLKQFVDGKMTDYPLPGIGGHFRSVRLFRTRDGNLWVGTVQGLLHLHSGWIDKFAAADGLSGDVVTGILEDRESNVWVSTRDGLDRFRKFAVPTISVDQGLSNSTANGVQATPDGSIWITTSDRLNRWQNGKVTVYGKPDVPGKGKRTDEREFFMKARVTEIANSGLRNTVYSLGLDDRGRLWAGNREGVFYFDGARFSQIPGLPGGTIFSIAGYGPGVWISNNDQGLFYATPEGAVQRIPWARTGHQYGASALLPDRLQGGLWLGFFEGGIAYVKDGQLRASYNAADGLGKGEVNDLHSGSDAAVWAATEGGLSRLKDGHVTTLTAKNGLPCNAVNWVIEDDTHSFWLYMSCGLVRVARSELDGWVSDSRRAVQTTVFDVADGVRSRAVAGRFGRKVTKSLEGKIWFAAQDGVSVIDPKHLPLNPLPPPVHIEQITADGKQYDGALGVRVLLPPRVHDLSIAYTALSLVAPEKVHFRFKLQGQDQNWREVLNRRRVEYSNLAPDNYRFRVIASNNSGVWNEAGDSLDFSIDPAYYQTPWFRVSVVVAFFVLLWALYRYRLHQIAQEFNARLDGRVDERLRVARDLHDTLLQSFQGLLLRFQGATNLLPSRPAEAKQTLESAIDLAAQAITEGRDAIQGLRSSTAETNELAQALKALGEDLAAHQNNGDGVESFVDVEGTPRDLHPILRDEIYRIAGEAMRNAFKHSGARRIEVAIAYGDRQLRVQVRDNGKGIDPRAARET